jgi:hypothetical protein
MRWTFDQIERASFRWTAERAPNDKNWRREVDLRARHPRRPGRRRHERRRAGTGAYASARGARDPARLCSEYSRTVRGRAARRRASGRLPCTQHV